MSNYIYTNLSDYLRLQLHICSAPIGRSVRLYSLVRKIDFPTKKRISEISSTVVASTA